MKRNKHTNLSLTVGITTCYGDPSILETVKALHNSEGAGNFQFIIISDRKPFASWVKRELKRLNIQLVENQTAESQTYKHKQILRLARGKILIFTQDDVLFAPTSIREIVNCFRQNADVTFVSICNLPLPSTSTLESVLNVGTRMNIRISERWNHGDNYLSVVGRCMAYRTSWAKKTLHVPNGVTTTDAYHYFNNRRHGGVYRYLPKTFLYFRNPGKYSEYARKSSRFQYSKLEMSRHFGDLTHAYQVPFMIKLNALLSEFVHNPIKFGLYICVYAYSRTFKLTQEEVLNPIWEVDVSTKKISSFNLDKI